MISLQTNKILKQIFWDVNVGIEDVNNAKTGEGWETNEYILRRLFERLSWYEIIDLLGISRIKEILTPLFIQKLRTEQLRKKYEFVRQILHGETVSISGWGVENRKRMRYTLLSDRWYRS